MTADPNAAVVELGFGGEMTFLELEDGYRLTVDTDGLHLSVPLTALDVAAIRAATGDLVLARLREVA